MKKSFYIVRLRQIGNVGANEILKMNHQPEEGFISKDDAEQFLFDISNPENKNNKKIGSSWDSFAIMELYHFNK